MTRAFPFRSSSFLALLLSLLLAGGNLRAQLTTFGDLIPPVYLPSSVKPGDLLDCARYFQIADSVNQRMYALTGVNPIPKYHGGNDTLSYSRKSIAEALNDLSIGTVLVRMIIDRMGSPVCCKVYMKGGENPGKQVEEALSKLILTPSYRNGVPIPTEYRFVYDFLAPRNPPRKVID